MEGKQHSVEECKNVKSEGPQTWPWFADEQKNPFPPLPTVVSAPAIEGLRIDLNYLGCLQKLSEVEADLKSCNKQHISSVFFLFHVGLRDWCFCSR